MISNTANPNMTIMSMMGRMSVNSDEDVRLTEVAKAEAIMGAELPIRVGGGADEVVCNDEANKLREMLKKESKNLDEEHQYHIIHCMPVQEIVSLALELVQGKGSDEERIPLRRLPCFGQLLRIIKRMENNPGRVKKAEFCLLYNKLHYENFAIFALSALECNQERCCYYKMDELESKGDMCLTEEDILKLLNPLNSDQRDMIPSLCRVLPPIVFDHVFHDMTKLHLFGSSQEESDEDMSNERAEASDAESFEESDVEYVEREYESSEDDEEECKKGAQECEMCLGKATHTGPNGYYCSYRNFVPKGATVGPGYWVVCRRCGRRNEHPVDVCWFCESVGGEAIPEPELYSFSGQFIP